MRHFTLIVKSVSNFLINKIDDCIWRMPSHGIKCVMFQWSFFHYDHFLFMCGVGGYDLVHATVLCYVMLFDNREISTKIMSETRKLTAVFWTSFRIAKYSHHIVQ